MSLEHQIPVMIKKTQMNGDRSSPCGLTSLLPMSCRGRAAAFARDLHSRLRNLGAAPDADDEALWITQNATHRTSNPNQRDSDTFYDFELECESPSSPVEELGAPFPTRSPTEETESFYDVESDPEIKEQTPPQLDKTQNGIRFETAFYNSPIKVQPLRENRSVDKPLYSAITFEGVARQNSWEEIDCVINNNNLVTDYLQTDKLSNHLNLTFDSDSEFDSAKSEPSEGVHELLEVESGLDVTPAIESLSIIESENIIEEETIVLETIEKSVTQKCELREQTPDVQLQIIKAEDEKPLKITATAIVKNEISPDSDKEPNRLTVENVEEDRDDDDKPQRVRRCSSLKTGKTPPGTPGRKKIVRFADVLGLDLADVKTFMDEIPVIPKSAYDDLTGCDIQNSPPVRSVPRIGSPSLVPLFQLPRDLTDKLEKLNVCLESARVCEGVHITICGSVRVRNLDFHKTVHVRYTINRWKTFTDLPTSYVQGSCDGYSDRFQFTLYAPLYITSGQRLEIAVRFQCKGQQFWDNNSGSNYCFDCLALGVTHPTAPSPGPLHPTVDWHPSFY